MVHTLAASKLMANVWATISMRLETERLLGLHWYILFLFLQDCGLLIGLASTSRMHCIRKLVYKTPTVNPHPLFPAGKKLVLFVVDRPIE